MAELPVEDDFRCAVWTAAQGFDPIGSATRLDRLVTVEVPQPWPAKTEAMEWIAPLEVPPDTRVQAIVAEVGRGDGSVLVNRWERAGASLNGVDWLVPAADVPDALAAAVRGDDPPGIDGTEAPPEILVCGHGARDRCCGGAGTRLAVEVRAALGDHIRVRRTSHLGGHRFAPTAMTLPDGRMWAFLDAAVIAGIVDRTLNAGHAREFYRGNVALDPWAQAVEADLLERGGWAAVDFDDIAAVTTVDGDHASVTLRVTVAGVEEDHHADVEVADRYPVLQCGLPPEEATKDAVEYRLV